MASVVIAGLLGGCHGETEETADESKDLSPSVGVVSQALGTSPDFGCVGATYNSHDYWFCPTIRSWSSARSKCEAAGYNLARVEDKAENDFLRTRIGLDSWIGGNDQTTEGTWVWTFGGSKFWSGNASGSPFGGLYTNWGLLQPDDLLNQDCLRMSALDGTWTDESCGLLLKFVCESGPDQCPADPQKVVPGACGCGVPDVDSDKDGTPDCVDQCPHDPAKIRPGDCGCADAPRASGTPCSDGLCAANNACNGAGVCGSPSACAAPDTNCKSQTFQNNYYWFCTTSRQFSDARQRCKNAGMDLSAVETALEDTFVESNASTLDHIYLGATDQAAHGTWVWSATQKQFWSGGLNGSATAGAYTNWEVGQPSDGLLGDQNCVMKDPKFFGGGWEGTSCSSLQDYVCESSDQCPTDPLKTTPGKCGCNVPETDTDGDLTPDCIDECPKDPNKTKRGITGCGNSDTDTDHDGVPPPLDDFPNDPTLQQGGQCGKPGSLAPAGTPCNDGPCPVLATCDGAGHCGSPSACQITGGGACTSRQVWGKTYWFCPAGVTRTQAETDCRSLGLQSLIEIDNAAENAFVSAVITADTWLAANDIATEGDWHWATTTTDTGPRFWSGAANGSAYFGAYAAWASGQPGGGTGQNCADISAAAATRGTWDDVSCTSTHAFVCEASTGAGAPGIPVDIPCANAALGLPCPQTEQCVPETTVYPNLDLSTDDGRNAAAAEAATELGQCGVDCHPGGNEAACRSECNGAIVHQDRPGDTCEQWFDQALSFCPLASTAQPVTPCETDTQCTPPNRCGFIDGPNGAERVCGIVSDTCPPAVPDPGLDSKCSGTPLLCADPDQTQTTTDWDDPSTLNPIPFDPKTVFGDPPTHPPTPYTANTQTPCDVNTGCQGLFTNHPWCTYAPASQMRTPNDAPVNPNANAGGDNKLITFHFDPHMNLHYDGKIGALGLPQININAEAGLGASADVGQKLIKSHPHIPIVDLLAAVDGTECSISTGRSSVMLLGHQFVPKNGATNAGPDATVCNNAFAQFNEAANRANKALRDAQALLTQYYGAIKAGNPLARFCDQLAPNNNVPAGFPTGTDCSSEAPATTIHHFIDYYRGTVLGFPNVPQAPSLPRAADALRALTADPAARFSNNFHLFNVPPGTEHATITSANFFIGPIPVTLEVYSELHYGVDVTANFSFDPGGFLADALLNPNPTDSPYQVAFLGVTGSPAARAAMGLFAGVGFSFPGLSARFGVSAELSLATLSLPAHAGAGLGMSTQLDNRAQPADLGDPVLLASGNATQNLLPAKTYVAQVDYALGLTANVSNILDGDVNAELKFEFFFFSVSWRKQLFHFTGFRGKSYPIISNAGELGQPLDFPWDTVQMPTPFPVLVPPDFLASGPLPVGTAPVDLKQIEELFYDSECACIQTGDTKRQCSRDGDCCDSKLTGADHASCFADPQTGKNICSKCRNPGDSCDTTTDCCHPVGGGTRVCGFTGNNTFQTCNFQVE